MDIQELVDSIEDTEDVGQKRYLMYHVFDRLLNKRLEQLDRDPDKKDSVKSLRDQDGYMYKLSQDFLTNSSTMKKEKTLEKIRKHVELRD
jgi:hypothetical protein